MDQLDDASEITMKYTNGAIAKASAALMGEGSEECEDCGEDIPKARKDAYPSCTRCVSCQDVFERKKRG